MSEMTPEKQAELEKARIRLLAMDQLVRNLLTGSSVGMVVVDARGMIRFANPAFAALHGCAAEEMIGRPLGCAVREEPVEVRMELPQGFAVVLTWGWEAAWDDEKAYLVIVADVTQARHREAELSPFRRRADAEINQLKSRLEDRTRQVQAVSQELEAFNHMISRSLRRSITNINSYCQVIRELCGSQLSGQCMRYLDDIYQGSLHMSHLIDALLKYSRLTLAEHRFETVDLSRMAEAVAAGLKMADPGRRVLFRIAAEITARGDPRLLWTVMENLLDNAWKFTREREEAIIEFGMTEIRGKPAYFVRDNGAGFEKAEAEKLFLPFPGLPGTEGLTGYGIGLATVDRIIRHHGGMVWASGERGRGATFYFTLQS